MAIIFRSCVLFLGILCISGCGDGIERIPVEGAAFVDGKPLPHGALLCKPTKGNPTTLEPAGIVEDGKYKLFTPAASGKPGAPRGWYKVIVVAQPPIDPKDPYAPRQSYIDSKYNAEATTDLTIEVTPTPAPGAYDLKLTK